MSNIIDNYTRLLRQDLSLMTRKCFHELNPSTPYLHNWHIDLITSKLMDCMSGKSRRLIINIPPRYLKSICASVALPAFWLGHDPSAQIICASYGKDLADKHAIDCRTVIQSAWYQALFPLTRLSRQKQAVDDFGTNRQGCRRATSVGGVLTGLGADVLIIDDPLKPDEAVSQTQRKKVNDWYDGVLYSRLNNKETGCIILIMQRLHEDDLVGHVLEQEAWDIVTIPAIAQEDETHQIVLPSCSYTHSRKQGDVLHPIRESVAVLERIKNTIGSYNFAGQYQQLPAPQEGGMVKKEWLKFYTPGEQPASFERIVQSWDTANKAGELNDYSVCTTWGEKNKSYYLLNVFRRKMEYPDLKRAVRDQAQFHNPSVILIEDKASGTQLIQDLKTERIYGIEAYQPPACDKIMRLNRETATFENGKVFLPAEAHWLADYMHEITIFPGSKHDDQVDSTTQALTWMRTPNSADIWIQYYKEECERTYGRKFS